MLSDWISIINFSSVIVSSSILIALPLINLLTSLLDFSNFDKMIKSIMFRLLLKSLELILIEGYIEENDIISLRGTLVPATTINRSIASIPLIGDLLIGKKAGDGVFGVSFKVKGPPKNLKTTVNPIKTLTPRFITRTLEKIKKN